MKIQQKLQSKLNETYKILCLIPPYIPCHPKWNWSQYWSPAFQWWQAFLLFLQHSPLSIHQKSSHYALPKCKSPLTSLDWSWYKLHGPWSLPFPAMHQCIHCSNQYCLHGTSLGCVTWRACTFLQSPILACHLPSWNYRSRSYL